VLGKDHSSVATTLNNLGLLYTPQGRYAEAESLYTRAIEIVEKRLGNDHPNVAVILEHYAALLHKIGRADEAARVEDRAKLIREKTKLKVKG